MVKLFVSINDWLCRRRGLTLLLLMLVVAVCVALSLRLRYEEDIARFLPVSPGQQAYQEAVEQLTNQDRIVIIFSGEAEPVKEAMDGFESLFAEADTAQTVTDMQVTVDETQMLDMLDFVTTNAPYFLTATDYQRMDSLLATDDYVATQIEQDKQLLSLPTAGVAAQTVRQDPLHLLSPVLGRLQAMGRNSRFTVSDGYVFTSDSRHGLAFLTSPYGMSESSRNAELAVLIDTVMAQTERQVPEVKVSAIGGPLIAVSNASQIKRDSLIAVSIAVVLIVALLVWHYRHLSYLFWMVASLAFGWLFALALMAVFRGTVSLIVLGIGSVIIGIAVNYPLHYLDHLKETGCRRQTLRDMVQPLLIGNITTVSAFLCLLWMDAAAMRDLGLFGSFMLIGTILFVLIFLPVWAKGRGTMETGERRMENEERSSLTSSFVTRKPFSAVCCFTFVLLFLFLGYHSLQLTFDSDIRHINYMSDEQREGMELLAGLSEDMPQEMTGMIPSAEAQQERLQLWRAFCERHPRLLADVQDEGRRQGFSSDAFQPFAQLLATDWLPQPADYFEPVGRFVGGQHLLNVKNVGSQLVEILSDNFNYVSFVCGFVVFVFLWLSFGCIELALLSFLPLAVSWVFILGLMHLFGVQFNIVNIILATFIFGQGDDYTIFITEGLTYEYATGRRRLRSYQRSVALSAVLMFIGIGTLIFAKHPALRSLAEVTIIGMGTVVLMAYLLPPIVFRWLVRGNNSQFSILNSQSSAYNFPFSLPLPHTLRRWANSLFSIGFFLSFMYLFVLPYTWLYFHLGKDTEERKLKYHAMLRRMSDYVIRHVPGVKFCLENRVGESFERPAVVISNHQSHLDLMCLMMLTPRIVFLTNDWVWHNPFYGMVIHRAEFYPVSNGIENNIDRLRSLYERGYSICVFPEGTRSADCNIQRFHKGAFYLAEQLGADILPVYLHGPGHVLPKRDFMLREGQITVEVGQRITSDDDRFSDDLLERTRQMRHHYQEHYASMCSRIETSGYWRSYRRYVEKYMHGYGEQKAS